MNVIRTRTHLHEWLKAERLSRPSLRLVLVPTMGFLHEGHLALIRQAKRTGDCTAVSIFINPLQFNDPGDYGAYPTNLERDLGLCKEEGVDVVFAPSEAEMLSDGKPSLRLSMPDLTESLCGPFRPGHFEGVLLIVSRFFNLFGPSAAVFGRKDFQQLVLIKRLVIDLDFKIDIIGVETVREHDGLAMSSRNVRLDEKSREHAGLIPRALRMGLKAAKDAKNTPDDVKEIVRDIIESGSRNKVEYVDLVDPDNLKGIDTLDLSRGFLLAVAVHASGVRLIDNIEHTPEG